MLSIAGVASVFGSGTSVMVASSRITGSGGNPRTAAEPQSQRCYVEPAAARHREISRSGD